MKKVLTKAMAVIMAAALCVGMCATAFAADTSSDDSGSITINNLTEGVTASAYQIAKATYDDDGNFLGYEMTVSSDKTTWKINSNGSWDDPTEADLAALFAALGSTEASGEATVAEGATSATIENLPVGSYLIVITGSESVIYSMMIGSVSYTTEEGAWSIDNGAINVTSDENLWAKYTTPSMEKTEHHTGGSDTHGESANVGDEITFDITVNPIPSYLGDYPVFDVDDQLTGLTMTQAEYDALTVRIVDSTGETVAVLEAGTDYTFKIISDSEFDVDFVVNGAYTLNQYAGYDYSIVIEYQATVNDSAVYEGGEAQHENDAVLHYSTTSYVYGEDTTDDDEDYEYTFTMDIHKTDDESQSLAGATFGLFTDSACTTAYTQNGQAVTAVSDDYGTITFEGLGEGTYYLKETEAPAGYLLNQAVYTVTISATYNENGTIDTWSIVITDADGETVGSVTHGADTGLTIINTNTALLPSTGGIGTTIFYVIGGVLVAGAVVVLVTRRRMNREA